MKKFIYLSVLLSAFIMTGYSQVFVGGSLHFDSSSGSQEIGGITYDNPTSVSFSFSPMAGYMLSGKLGIGIRLDLGLEHTNSNDDPEVVTNTTGIGLSPFVRYYVVHANKFSLYGQAQPSVTFSTIRSKLEGDAVDGPYTMAMGITVYPGIAYDLNEKIQLNASVNLFNVGFMYRYVKDGGKKSRSTESGFGIDLNDIVNTGAISIGAIIRL
jgi:hypothetical protein